MAAVTFQTVDAFLTEVAKGAASAIDLTVDDLEIYFSNASPNRASAAVASDLPQITQKNGYAGPVTLTITSRGIHQHAYRIVASDPPTWEGTDATDGTGFGPFQYVVLLDKSTNATFGSRKIIGYWTYPSAITVADGDFFKVDFSATDGMVRFESAA
jgi:hypothetical protein